MSKEKNTRVTASHILVDSLESASDIVVQLAEGTEFDALATKHSKCPSNVRGGSLGEFGRDQMVKPFEDAAFNLNVGEVSTPVQTQFGWHVIKRTA